MPELRITWVALILTALDICIESVITQSFTTPPPPLGVSVAPGSVWDPSLSYADLLNAVHGSTQNASHPISCFTFGDHPY